MDKTKWFENPVPYTLVKTTVRTGIFESNKPYDIELYQPLEVGESIRGKRLDNGKDFISSRIRDINNQGATIEVTTSNSVYRLVAGQGS